MWEYFYNFQSFVKGCFIVSMDSTFAYEAELQAVMESYIIIGTSFGLNVIVYMLFDYWTLYL